jgi:hypothetical protein
MATHGVEIRAQPPILLSGLCPWLHIWLGTLRDWWWQPMKAIDWYKTHDMLCSFPPLRQLIIFEMDSYSLLIYCLLIINVYKWIQNKHGYLKPIWKSAIVCAYFVLHLPLTHNRFLAWLIYIVVCKWESHYFLHYSYILVVFPTCLLNLQLVFMAKTNFYSVLLQFIFI